MEKEFKPGEYFAWGDELGQAEQRVSVSIGHVSGSYREVLTFDDDFCTRDEAMQVCELFTADTTFLRLGSDNDLVDDEGCE